MTASISKQVEAWRSGPIHVHGDVRINRWQPAARLDLDCLDRDPQRGQQRLDLRFPIALDPIADFEKDPRSIAVSSTSSIKVRRVDSLEMVFSMLVIIIPLADGWQVPACRFGGGRSGRSCAAQKSAVSFSESQEVPVSQALLRVFYPD